jgi:hypothetical protein
MDGEDEEEEEAESSEDGAGANEDAELSRRMSCSKAVFPNAEKENQPKLDT